MTNTSIPEEDIGLPGEAAADNDATDAENILGLTLEEEEGDDELLASPPDQEIGAVLFDETADEPVVPELTAPEEEEDVDVFDSGESPGEAVTGESAPEPVDEEDELLEETDRRDDGGDGWHSVSKRLDTLEDLLGLLAKDFETKLKYDEHKEKIIDMLHRELQEYKQDLLKKLVLSFVLDTIKLADDIRKWIAHFKALDPSQRDPIKLFRYLEAIPSDLEDIFHWQGVKPFSSTEGEFDPARQRALKRIPTEDADLDKTIAHSIRPGYEWEGKVIRQEMVAVYIHSDASK
jgi:molecular chaperone GrpE (heat shock protein)